MATLTIRNLPDDVRIKLRTQAAQNGRSMEAEARELLQRAVATTLATPVDDITERVRNVQNAMRPYLPKEGSIVDEFLAERRKMWGEE